MNVDKDTLNKLLSSLKSYNPTANTFSEAVAKVVLPVAIIIVGIMWYMDFVDVKKQLTSSDANMGFEFWIQSSMKYVIGIMLITFSPMLIDAVMYISSVIGHLINSVSLQGGHGSVSIPEITKKAHGWEKFVIGWLQSVGRIGLWTNQIIAKLLIFLRFLMLYVMKAVAPIMIASYVSDEFKSVAIGYIKQFTALIIQGFVLLLILKIYPVLINNDIFNVAASGDVAQNLAAMFLVIAKAFVIAATLIGSQVLTRRWMGV
ncbi:hypothetical protein ESZ50_10240 [Weissella muntiaci]|uniref:Conjugal transfer protein TrbL n=1 Tax=Weissella muntiaci TaxID=2508881 RepID=A0A6C2C1R7_9LACO|nr:hypothetical protein [Weissella muntiaci]TYC48000.1 hypothetical protein ESZ50_10240 [Weissella muntiaci]